MKQVIRNFIEETFFMHRPDDEFGDDDSLMDTGAIDSTGVLELIGWLETNFSITVADEELTPSNLDSVNKIAVFVGRKL